MNTIIIDKNTVIPNFETKVFTGVGSQGTPPIFKNFMAAISYVLGMQGYVFRSGKAKGSDHFFEIGVPPHMRKKAEIYIPQLNFGTNTGCRTIYVKDSNILMEAMYLISKHNIHEHWNELINSRGNSFAVSAHTRNVFQILGLVLRNEVPTKFVICWTKCGSVTFDETSELTGGTRTAIRLANINNIPVFNLCRREHSERLYKMVQEARLKIRIPFHIPNFQDLEPFIYK